MSNPDRQANIQELKDLIKKFCEERGWQERQTPRSLASSISIEAGELLEHFQWDDYQGENKQAVADELADVLFYCFNFANVTDIDITTAFKDKLEKASQKYPLKSFQGGDGNMEEYFKIKNEYRGKKTP